MIENKKKIENKRGGGVGESWRGLLTSPNPKPQKKIKSRLTQKDKIKSKINDERVERQKGC